MNEKHFNKLTPAEDERLALLAEECAEVVKAVTKIQRHGYESHNPHDLAAGSNRAQLENEIGNVIAAVRLLTTAGDVRATNIAESTADKLATVRQYLHHNRGLATKSAESR